MRVFIAEKPSQGKALAEYLEGPKTSHRGKNGVTHITVGSDVVTWCVGHIYELCEPQDYDEKWAKWDLSHLPIIPGHWQLKPKADKKEQIRTIKDLITRCSVVINAGDPDREGQLLVDEVLEELGCRKPVKRILISAYDEKSIKRALSDIRDNGEFQNLKASAEARARGDWLVGMNATRKMTLLGRKAGLDGVISVGRVQTPTLSLIVQRDLAIESFRPKDYFTVDAVMTASGREFPARWVPQDSISVDEEGRVLDGSVAASVAKKLSGRPARVEKSVSDEKTEAQPLPFSLDKLQMECNRRFGLSAQQTLDIAQHLYEAKLITYPRTDCGYLPESQHADAAEVLKGLSAQYPTEVAKCSAGQKTAAWNDKKVTAHHGIIPTGERGGLSGNEALVFDLIVRRYIAQFYLVAKYLETHIEMSCEGEKLVSKGRFALDQGWKELFKHLDAKAPGQPAEAPVTRLDLATGAEVLCLKADAMAKKTTPPQRFTEETLLSAMLNVHQFETDPEIKKRLKETAGIGTPATRSGIIETLKKRGFIQTQKKALVSTQLGRELIKVLPLQMKSPGLTAIFEDMLETVAMGQKSKEEFLQKQTEFVTTFVQTELAESLTRQGPEHKCPKCHEGELRKRQGSYGPFWGCNQYPACDATFADQKGQPDLSPKPTPNARRVASASAGGGNKIIIQPRQ